MVIFHSYVSLPEGMLIMMLGDVGIAADVSELVYWRRIFFWDRITETYGQIRPKTKQNTSI